MAQKITTVTVRNLKPADKKYDVMDTGNPGFGVWVYPSGKKTFIYAYRVRGRKGRITLKSPGLAEAREEYRTLRALVKQGIDPQQQKAEERRQQEQDLTFGELSERYIAEELSRKAPRYAKNTESALRIDPIKQWGKIKAKQLRRRDVQDMLRAIVDRGSHTQANRTLSNTKRVFNWGIEQDLVENNPCAGVKAPSVERSRERVLNDEEIRTLWTDLNLPLTVRLVLQLQLLTATRGSESLGMRWDELNLEEKIWTLPGGRVKNTELHVIPLSPLALEVIERARVLSNNREYVFPSQKTQRPIRIDSLGTAIDRAIKHTDMEPFSSHDLRRTAATNISGLGFTDDLLKKILNHKDRSVTGRYRRYDHLKEKREALQAWAAKVGEIVGKQVSASVTPIKVT